MSLEEVKLEEKAGWWAQRPMRASSTEYLGLKLRAHELLQDIPLYDVSAIDLPGGGPGRSIADIRLLDTSIPPSRIAIVLYAARHFFGRVFGWDRRPIPLDETLLSRLSERDRTESEIIPGARDGDFVVLYQFPYEQLRETRNATVHGFWCSALAPTSMGYRLYWGIYVRRVSWLSPPYLVAIEPLRWILYPAMLRRIQRAWSNVYGQQ